MDRVVMSVAETARALGLSRNTIYRGIRRGQIPATRLGGLLLVPVDFVGSFARDRRSQRPEHNGGGAGRVLGGLEDDQSGD